MLNLTQDQLTYIIKTVVDPLAQRGAKVYCFGSRARGDNVKYSDLDLMVEFDTKVHRSFSDICEQLTEEGFPFIVDLVDSAQFAESYRSNYLKERVLLLPSWEQNKQQELTNAGNSSRL